MTSSRWTGFYFDGGIFRLEETLTLGLVATVLTVECRAGTVHIDDPGITAIAANLSCWRNPSLQVVVLVSESAIAVYRIVTDPTLLRDEILDKQDQPPHVRVEPKGQSMVSIAARMEHDDFLTSVCVRPAPDGSLIIRYPRGIICLDEMGYLRWQRNFVDISATLVEVDDREVWLESQVWDADGKRTSFRLSDGESQESRSTKHSP